MKKLPIYIFVVLFVLALLQLAYYYPQLPEAVASHFNWEGESDALSSKRGFFFVQFSVLLILVLAFIVLPLVLEKMRVRQMSVPNRDYWLAPERREKVYQIIREKMCWFGSFSLAFLIVIHHLVFRANLEQIRILDAGTVLTLLGIYFVFVIIWIVSFYLRFTKTK